MYEAEAKERAYRNQSHIGTLGAGIGTQCANMAVSANVPPPTPTVVGEIINSLENLNGMLRDVICSQNSLLAKLHGPAPDTSGCEKGAVSPSGLLHIIEERLGWLQASAHDLIRNQQILERLA